jgi:membrane protease YdiL (CAAX protease family)
VNDERDPYQQGPYGPDDPQPEGPQEEPGLFGRMNNWFLLIYALACYLMASSLMGIFYLNGNVVLSVIVPGVFGYILPLMIITRRYSLSFLEEFRLHAPDARTMLIVIIIAAAAIYPVDALSWLFRRGRPVDSDYIEILLAFKPKGVWNFAGMALGLGIITAVGEELLYRGTVQSIFHRNMSVFAAVSLAALVFAASHGSAYVIPGTTLLGAILGWVFYRTGILTYSIAIHAIFNLFSLYRLSRLSEETIRAWEWSAPDVTRLVISTAVLIAALVWFNRSTARTAQGPLDPAS